MKKGPVYNQVAILCGWGWLKRGVGLACVQEGWLEALCVQPSCHIMWVGLAEKRGGAGCVLNLLHSKSESLNIRH
jgi:hypothetical protein